METRQRRYVRVPMQIIQLEQETKKDSEYTKQELRRLLTQRRNVIGPNGEDVRIPKHMAVNDIITLIKDEYGLTVAEITGILVTLKHFENNPEFCGKVNRVVASGIESPLKIERPEGYQEKQDEEVKTDSIIRMPHKPIHTRTIMNENEYRYRSAEINQIIANRYRAEAAAERQAAEARRKQDEKLEKQLNEYYERQGQKRENRKRVGLVVASLVAALYVTGVIGDVIDTTRQAMTPGENLTPLKVQTEQGGNGILKDSNNFQNVVTPLVYTPTATPVIEQSGYESFEYSIDSVSKELKPNTNFTNALNKFSATSGNPIIVGEIASYQDFESLLQSGDEILYTSGPAYFANFSRQALHGMLKDKFEADRVAATYEKIGENNQIYEFNIRYFKDGSSDPRTVEGRVKMQRNEEGRLETKEYHKLPYEVYELLATIGEFSDFIGGEDGNSFDIVGYAERFTNGDIEKAREELKERMTYGMEAMKNVIKIRAREENVKEYTGYQR